MKRIAATTLNPRKAPVQARSAASVEAILEATIQVLINVGKDQLTTTKVASRAGVSVGTLYQYFPNKGALLQAALKRHLNDVRAAVDAVCMEQRCSTFQQMATGLVNAFLRAKMKNAKASVALYAVSADVGGARIAREIFLRCNAAIAEMLRTAREPLNRDPQIVASVLQATMAGISRNLLESDSPETRFEIFRQELISITSAYLETCSVRSRAAVQINSWYPTTTQ